MVDKFDMSSMLIYVGATIRTLREGRRITQSRLASAYGSTGNCQSRYEMGSVIMGIDKLATIAVELGVTPNDLFPPSVRKSESIACRFYELSERNQAIIATLVDALIAWQNQNEEK